MAHSMETGTPENITKDILSLSVKDYEALLEWVHKVTIIPAGLDTRAKENMLAYRIYDAIDPLLVLERQRGNDITALYNNATTSIVPGPGSDGSPLRAQQELEHKRQALLYLLTNGQIGQGCRIEPPIQVDYGNNLTLGDRVVWGSKGVVLDCAPVSIGEGTVLGTGVKLFAATHPINPLLRYPVRMFDFAMEIRIGRGCWVGGGSVVCPGVSVGDGVVVLPGSVVSKNVPSFVVVARCPAEVLRVLDREEKGDRRISGGGVEVEVGFGDDEWTPPVVDTMVLP